ncbi:ESX secretion-associated protein EspG [Nocardia jejuensis]|uniref:ESX secretion-associated protein EspG n=1 Tax=Nocardia jejuensis TaxID=328049 RepID=UPI0008302ED4|nr:ESX secretion-associated protein EspG [Nocardia jejuensis]
MHRTWSFTDLEFLVLWEESGEEFLPRPLTFMSRTEWWDDHLANKARARDDLRDRDPELASVLHALCAPDVRVEVHGWDGHDRLDAAGSIRLLAVRFGDLGYLVTQLPGETVRHSAGFTVTEFEASKLASEVVAALPDTESGRGRDIVLAEEEHIDEIDFGYGMSPAHETLEGTVVTRASDFLAAPAENLGRIDVVQGHSRFGPRGITRHVIEWRDLVQDGRYVVTGEHPPVAAPADRRRMTATLDTRISAVILALEDEWAEGQVSQ